MSERLKYGERKKLILDLAKEKGRIRSKDLVQSLGMTWNYASVQLLHMHRLGQLQRNGEPRNYVYSLPEG